MYYIETSLGRITFETENISETTFTWNVDYEFNCKNFHTEDNELLYQLLKRYEGYMGVSIMNTDHGYFLIVKTCDYNDIHEFKVYNKHI